VVASPADATPAAVAPVDDRAATVAPVAAAPALLAAANNCDKNALRSASQPAAERSFVFVKINRASTSPQLN
jgi:hypothetical protein